MKKKKEQAICECCANLVAVGEGDHICYERGELVMSISNYAPTEEYLKCGGRKYKED